MVFCLAINFFHCWYEVGDLSCARAASNYSFVGYVFFSVLRFFSLLDFWWGLLGRRSSLTAFPGCILGYFCSLTLFAHRLRVSLVHLPTATALFDDVGKWFTAFDCFVYLFLKFSWQQSKQETKVFVNNINRECSICYEGALIVGFVSNCSRFLWRHLVQIVIHWYQIRLWVSLVHLPAAAG